MPSTSSSSFTCRDLLVVPWIVRDLGLLLGAQRLWRIAKIAERDITVAGASRFTRLGDGGEIDALLSLWPLGFRLWLSGGRFRRLVVASQARLVDRRRDVGALDFEDGARLALPEQTRAVRLLKADRLVGFIVFRRCICREGLRPPEPFRRPYLLLLRRSRISEGGFSLRYSVLRRISKARDASWRA
jgi:hypothetical protein